MFRRRAAGGPAAEPAARLGAHPDARPRRGRRARRRGPPLHQKSGSLTSDAYDGLIGPEVLRQFTVTFDYGALAMFLEKNARYGRADRWDGTGMWLGQRGDAFAVLDVMPGSPAADAGLRVGDEIMSIDGQPTKALSLPSERLRLYFDGRPRRVALMLGDGRSVTLTLRRLV